MRNLHHRFVLYVVPVKSTVEILQNFVGFSEYMNFKRKSSFLNQMYIELGPKCFLDKSFQVRHFVDILYCDGFARIIPNNLNNFFVNFILESNKDYVWNKLNVNL